MNIFHAGISRATNFCARITLLSLALFGLAYSGQATCGITDSVDYNTARNYYGGIFNAPDHPNATAFAALRPDGSIIAWGGDGTGGTNAPSDSGYTQIYSTEQAFAALKSDGSITAWGHPDYGGSGAPTDSGYTRIYANGRSFTAIKADGSIVSWGGNVSAPTDSGYTEVHSTFQGFSFYALAALKSDGSITAWGNPIYGGAGAPTDNGYTQIVSSSNTFVALKDDGSVASWGYLSASAPSDSGYTQLFSTYNAFAALKTDSSITAWGHGQYGGINAPTDSGYVQIYSNNVAFAAIKTDGSITAWGHVQHGGTGAPTDNGYVRVYATENAFAALKSDGSIFAWGNSNYGGSGAPTDAGYINIYSTSRAFAAMKADGSIVTWGPTAYGGDGPTGAGYKQIHSTRDVFTATKADGSFVSWGGSPPLSPPSSTDYAIPYGFICSNDSPTDIILSPDTIDENVVAGTTVGTLSTIDPNPGDVHTYSFTTGCANGGADNDDFTLNVDRISINDLPDYETKNSYNLCVTTDDGTDTYEGELQVTVNDLNAAPTDIALTNDQIEEKQSAGTAIGDLSATDDGEQNPETYTYTLNCATPGVDDAHFTINGNALQSATVFDFDSPVDANNDNNYEICVRTTETNGGLFYDKNMTITVTDDSNQPPTDITLAPGNVDENVAGNTTVGTLATADPDTGDTHTYSFTTGCANGGTDNPTFSINGDQLSINVSPDYETKNSYALCITTSDGADIYEGEITVAINDLNAAPTGVTISQNTIEEKQAAGATIGSLATTDDGEQNPESYTYLIGCATPGVDDSHFAISGNNLQSAAVFDFDNPVDNDADNDYEICVRVTEANGGLTYDQNLTITVIDDGNQPPTDIILSPDTIDENVAAGTTVGTLSTVDPDVGDTHNYSFTTGCANGGADNDDFTLNVDQISINDLPDYETKNSYNLCVTTDDGVDTYEGEITVTVNDLNAAPTDIALTNDQIEEKQSAGTAVGDLSVTDDGEQNPETYTYALNCATPGVDDSHFTITGNSLQSATVFDFDNPLDANSDNDYEICIRVTEDNGGLTYDENFTITVTDDGNNPPADITLAPDNVDENVAPNTTIGTLTTTDPDTGDTHTYSFTTGCANGGADNGAFAITNDQLSIDDSPDYETKNSYALCITTSDGADTYEKEITVTVNDLNAAPTDITLSQNTIQEGQAVGTTIGSLTTTDDGEQNPESYTYAFNCATPGADDSHFAISGNDLQSATVFDFDNPVDANTDNDYEICIRVTEDNGGLTYDKNFIISVTSEEITKMPIYRFWSDTYRSHFYTISKSEQEHVIDFYPTNVWRYEGIAYKASKEKTETTHPIYRFWSEAYQKHFYTIDEKEKDKVISGAYPASRWRYEGIAWYSEKSPNDENFPLYRFWSDAYNGHFYTLSESEKQEVIDKYPDNIWRYEGNAWYGWR